MDEQAIFIAALERDADARRDYLDEACVGDSELRRRVEKLLAAHENAASFLGQPAGELAAAVTGPISEAPGTVIGPYTLLQQIGEGGMGVVYMAEQTEPVERRVALKIIKPGMDTRQVIARFEAERHALAMMDHPNIARVLDAGTTETGRPYFVMELVKGVPITQYCDEHHLTPQERLELFVPVCHAVQHAHQKGIIHRDIKPGNVLVAEYDDRPVPKIIDFGVAKAIQQRLSERTVFTQLGQVVGTIEYMSPEQAKLNELDVDTRSDVYSLGVLLYELLTGETPLDPRRLRGAAFDEMLRIIREEEPPSPSVRLSSSDSLPSIAANRQIEPKKLSTLVRGELDWIVMKALEKDRARRYETANALAADVEHYLADEPVVACPPSAAYRFRKFARRNRPLLATAGFIGLILLTASLVSTWQAVRATRAFRLEMAAREEAESAHGEANRARNQAERDRDHAVRAERVAQQQRDRAQAAEQLAEANFAKARAAVDEYLTRVTENELLTVPGLQPLRRDLLAAARTYYEDFVNERSNQPDLQIDLAAAYYRLGVIQRELGESAAAAQANGRAIELLEAMRQRGEDTPAIKTQLANAFLAASRYQDTVQLCQELLAGNSENVEGNSLLGIACNQLALVEKDAGRTDSALQWHRQAFAVREQLVRKFPNDPKHLTDMSSTLNNLGVLLDGQGHVREAMEMYLQAADYCQRAFDMRSSSILAGRFLSTEVANVAIMQARLGLDDEAMASYQRLVDVRRKLVWENPAVASLRGDLVEAWQRLGVQQKKLGRAAEMQGSLRAARDILENIPRETPEQMVELAAVYGRLARPQVTGTEPSSEEELFESQRNAELAVETLRKAVDAGYRDVQTLKTSPDLEPLRERDDFRQMIAALEKTAQAEQLAGRDSGTDAQKLEDRRRAVALLDQLVADEPENLRHQQTLAATLHSIGVIQTGLEQYDEAERSLQRALELQESLQTQQPHKVGTALELADARIALADAYRHSKRTADAHRLWQAALAGLDKAVAGEAGDQAFQRDVASCERKICQRYGAMGLWELAAAFPRHNAALKRIADSISGADFAVLLAAMGEQDPWREYCRCLVPQGESKPAGEPPAPQVRTILLFDPPGINAEECIGLAIKLLESNPHRYYHHFCLALAQYRASRYGEALKTIESRPVNASWESIDGEGNKLACAYLYALAAQGDGRKEEALVQLDRAEALYRNTCKSQLAEDRTELTEPFRDWFWDLATAQVLRREAWEKIKGHAPPAEPWWHLIQARGYGLLGESERAEQESAAAAAGASADPEIWEVWMTRARLFERFGDAARAKADWKKASELVPVELATKDPRPWTQRARLYARAGQVDKAALDFIRANELLAVPCGWDPNSALFASLIEHEEVFARISELRPDDLALWGQRGQYFALRGQWKQALPAYARASDLLEFQLCQAQVLLLTGDEEGYRRVCRQMADRYGQTDDPLEAAHLVWACSARPQSGIAPARIVGWAQVALSSGRNKFTLDALALASYRAGQFDQAVTLLQEAIGLPEAEPESAAAFPLALAYRALGQEEESRKWYETGVKELNNITPPAPGSPVSWAPAHWLNVNVWYGEAKAVFEATDAQASKADKPE